MFHYFDRMHHNISLIFITNYVGWNLLLYLSSTNQTRIELLEFFTVLEFFRGLFIKTIGFSGAITHSFSPSSTMALPKGAVGVAFSGHKK